MVLGVDYLRSTVSVLVSVVFWWLPMKYSYLRERIKAMAVQSGRNGNSRITAQQAEINAQALQHVVAKNGKNGNSARTIHHYEKKDVSLNESDIAARAFNIWLSQGCPNGKEVEHWLEAEKQLRIEVSMNSH